VFGKRLEQPQRGGEITAGRRRYRPDIEHMGFDDFRLDSDNGFLLIERLGHFDDFRLTAIPASCLSSVMGASTIFVWSVTTTLRFEVASLPSGCLDLNVSS
jgi:hypothetical protein